MAFPSCCPKSHLKVSVVPEGLLKVISTWIDPRQTLDFYFDFAFSALVCVCSGWKLY